MVRCIYIPRLVYVFSHRWTVGLFYLLTIGTDAARNVGVRSLSKSLLSFLWCMQLESELLDHIVILCQVF